jgi:riboflavin synthase
MFTGIIEEVGTIRSAERGTLVIDCRQILGGVELGDSVAINGVDLTVAALDGEGMTFNCMPETYRRSNLGELQPGDPVNLERGVVEATGELMSLMPEEDAFLARYRAPQDILRHTIVKGPITIDGASLTVIDKDSESLTVSLVRFTQEHTNLTSKKPGDSVNLESDIIARYVDQLLSERATSL